MSAVKRFVVAGGQLPSSIDPLELDGFNEYFPGQMIYLTPLQVSSEGKLESNLLSDFSYNESTNTISFKLGKWTYSDGSRVTIQDIVLAIKRMALARPTFPVLRYIDGIEQWVKEKYPLLANLPGLKIHGDDLDIKLTEKVYHPLFRFTLTIFSVVPEKCIDLKTSKFICDKPPSSGYYIQENTSNNTITYKKRQDLPTKILDNIPEIIVFDYNKRSIDDFITNPEYDTVVYGFDLDFTPEQHKAFSTKYHVDRLAHAWFSVIYLNPSIESFQDTECRHWFAEAFRRSFSAQDLGPIESSSSIFTKIIPGYKSSDALSTQRRSQDFSEPKCLSSLSKNVLEYYVRGKDSTPTLIQNALNDLSSKYGFRFSNQNPGQNDATQAFYIANSGFWALDPVGDIQMLLTPNMHKSLSAISNDTNVQDLLNKISKSYSIEDISKNMQHLNQYLYDSSIFNIFSNQSYIYISSRKKEHVKNAANSVLEPYPWQVF